MLQKVGPAAFSLGLEQPRRAWWSVWVRGLAGGGEVRGVVLTPGAEIPDKGGSLVLTETSCAQLSLDTAGSQLPGLEKDLDFSSKSPLRTGPKLLKAIGLTVGRSVLESGGLQTFWEVMLEGCLLLLSQAELVIILLGP